MAYALTILIGLSLGTFGAGGAILLLPVLVHVAKVPPPQAIPMSMAIMSVTSLAGALGYLRRGELPKRVSLVFGLGGMTGAFAGSWLTHLVAPATVMTIFSIVLAVVGTFMLTRRNALTCSDPCLPPRCFAIAAAIGVLTGFLGVGGGFLLVPALMRFAGLSPRQAAGTSLALIGVNSLTGLAGQLRFVSVDWNAILWLLLAALTGLAVGLWLSRRVPGDRFRPVLGVLLLSVSGINFAVLYF